MQKKSGYLANRAATRKDNVKVYAGKTYEINPKVQEGLTFIGKNVGTVQMYLPQAKAGRKFTFITESITGNNRIEINPHAGILSEDRIYDVSNSAFMLPGFTVISPDAEAEHRITLECHNDGYWSVTNQVGADWVQPAREFTTLVTHNTGSEDGYLGMTGDPAVQVDLYVKNDKFVLPGIETDLNATNDDLDAMTQAAAGTTGDVCEAINPNHVRFNMGASDEVIGIDLVVDDGYADILITAASMEGAAVEATNLRVPIYGIKGDLSGTNGEALGNITITTTNDEFRADIATEAVWSQLIELTDDYDHEDINITGVTRSSDTVIIVATSGDVTQDSGTGGILINHMAFTGAIKESEINQKLEGAVGA